MKKGRIIAKFFIDKNGHFRAKLDIRKQPDNFFVFMRAAAASMVNIMEKMEVIYGRNHSADDVSGVRGAESELKNQ